MELINFVKEQPDNDSVWNGKFSKSDIMFLDKADYEQFKRDLASYLFELRYKKQNFLDDIEAGCRKEFSTNYEFVFNSLVKFLNIDRDNRPVFDECEPDKFISAFEKYLIQTNTDNVDMNTVGQTVKKILLAINSQLRSCFVKFEVLSDNDEKKKDSREFTQMTSQIGEILATLTFQHFRDCGELVHAKIVLDNPNMPRHGEDMVGYAYNPDDASKDVLYLVEAKSTKGAINPQIQQVKERFTKYLYGIPYPEINRLREDIQQKLGEQAMVPRRRIADLLWEIKSNPNHKQIVAGAFFHFPSNYSLPKDAFSDLGDIQVKQGDTIVKMDPGRIHVITFKFDDFEKTVREIFEKAWTI